MTHDDFARQVQALEETMHRVSSGLLPSLHDRQDAVQEAILKAWKGCRTLRNEELFKPWLIRIVINECYQIMRKRKRISLTAVPEEAGECAALDESLRNEALHEALTQLSEKSGS